MPRHKSVQKTELLKAALEGLEAHKKRIEEQIGQVQAMLGRRPGRPAAAAAATSATAKPTGRRKLSAAARKRIAIAQRRRWAEFRKSEAK